MDTPYSYSSSCTWHGHPREAARRRQTDDGLEPACPYCSARLIEVPSAEVWWSGVRRLNAQRREYEEMMRWSEGKCFPDFETLESAFRQAMEGQR